MRSKDGMPYLEVHHVKQLKDGGSDRIDNAVALCPNCHRKAHYGKEKSKFQKLLKLQAMKNII
jgi:5-methylcytosine-specific restriction protein A